MRNIDINKNRQNFILLHFQRWAHFKWKLFYWNKIILKIYFIARKMNSLIGVYQDQTKLTFILVGIVLVFFMGELPTHLASRRSAVNLFCGGDLTKVLPKKSSWKGWASFNQNFIIAQNDCFFIKTIKYMRRFARIEICVIFSLIDREYNVLFVIFLQISSMDDFFETRQRARQISYFVESLLPRAFKCYFRNTI